MWPNEPRSYREARDKLLAEEAKLRMKAEAVARLRRDLPAGGRAPEDYAFVEAQTGKTVRLSEMFSDGQQTLLAYSFMYAPGGKPCPMCVSLLDSLNGAAGPLRERASLAVIAKADAPVLAEFAKARGWDKLPLYSSGGNDYNRTYRAESGDGRQLPIMHVWERRDGEVRHFWASELLDFNDPDWQQQPRHVDAIWPLWNLLDLTPEGRGSDWYPKV